MKEYIISISIALIFVYAISVAIEESFNPRRWQSHHIIFAMAVLFIAVALAFASVLKTFDSATITKSEEYKNLPQKEKEKLIEKAARGANEEQRHLVQFHQCHLCKEIVCKCEITVT